MHLAHSVSVFEWNSLQVHTEGSKLLYQIVTLRKGQRNRTDQPDNSCGHSTGQFPDELAAVRSPQLAPDNMFSVIGNT